MGSKGKPTKREALWDPVDACSAPKSAQVYVSMFKEKTGTANCHLPSGLSQPTLLECPAMTGRQWPCSVHGPHMLSSVTHSTNFSRAQANISGQALFWAPDSLLPQGFLSSWGAGNRRTISKWLEHRTPAGGEVPKEGKAGEGLGGREWAGCSRAPRRPLLKQPQAAWGSSSPSRFHIPVRGLPLFPVADSPPTPAPVLDLFHFPLPPGLQVVLLCVGSLPLLMIGQGPGPSIPPPKVQLHPSCGPFCPQDPLPYYTGV